jgi:hypothetical protein
LKDNRPAFELYYHLALKRTGWMIRRFHPITKEIWNELEIKTDIKKWQKILATPMKSTICPRCFGEGKIPRFGHVKGGDCFKCDGKGVIINDKAPE